MRFPAWTWRAELREILEYGPEIAIMGTRTSFQFEALTPGSKGVYHLRVASEALEGLPAKICLAIGDVTSEPAVRAEISAHLRDGYLSIPVLAACGVKQGKALVVTAGIHGDEYEGIEAIYRVFEALDPQRMTGSFVGVPIVTLPAFWLGTRLNPLDLQNMARVFPGSLRGTLSQRLAWALVQEVFRHASLYVDLHSAGRHYRMLTLCGYTTVGGQAAMAREGAECFGAPVIWEHPDCSPGRTLSATLAMGIPSLYTEAYGGGHVRAEDLECYTRGVANLLKFLDITEIAQAKLAPDYRPLRLCGSGDLDFVVSCTHSGLFFSSVSPGAKVRAGDNLGTVRTLEGKIIETVVAPNTGVVVFIRATARIFGGERVAALAQESPGSG